MRRIRLTIEELVLHGFDAANRRAIGDAVQAELARHLAAGGLPSAWHSGAAIERAATADVHLPVLPRDAGTAIGAALHHSLSTLHTRGRK
jgi:hypothetical protein